VFSVFDLFHGFIFGHWPVCFSFFAGVLPALALRACGFPVCTRCVAIRAQGRDIQTAWRDVTRESRQRNRPRYAGQCVRNKSKCAVCRMCQRHAETRREFRPETRGTGPLFSVNYFSFIRFLFVVPMAHGYFAPKLFQTGPAAHNLAPYPAPMPAQVMIVGRTKHMEYDSPDARLREAGLPLYTHGGSFRLF
jgi:hypothetical protein